MAIIVREEKTIGGKSYVVKVYKTESGKLITKKEKEKAEKFDEFLKEKVKQIEQKMKDTKLLNLKGKRGRVLKLWYEVGKELEFVMDTSIVAAEDRKFVWRAIYDHAEKLARGPLPVRVKRSPETSLFSYCYKVSRFTWEFVKNAGDWTSWSTFLDRKETRNDSRIIEWLGKKEKEDTILNRQNWLRPITKAIHGEFKNKDTTVFSDEELYEKLDKIFSGIRENEEKKK